MADLEHGAKTGLLFDQRPKHTFGARVAQWVRVLDVFFYVGGVGFTALADSAKEMCFENQLTTRKGDAFDALGALVEVGKEIDVVICGPPSSGASREALIAGLHVHEKLAWMTTILLRDGKCLGFYNCSDASNNEKFYTAFIHSISKVGRSVALIQTGFSIANHPIHPQLAESGYLKTLFFR